MIRQILALAVCAAIAAPVPAVVAQTSQSVAAYRDWTVFAPSSTPKECYIVSPPVSSEARRGGQVVSVQRGDIRLFVSFRPAAGVSQEISFTGGYPFRPDSTVDVRIGSSEYKMAVGSGDSNEWAWLSGPAQDAEMIAAMRRGASARLTAVSARGTTTIDNFSLLGFTAALEEAQRLCG